MSANLSSRPEFRRRAAAEPCLPPVVPWRSEGFAEDLEPAAVARPAPAPARDGWRLALAGLTAAWTVLPPTPRG